MQVRKIVLSWRSQNEAGWGIVSNRQVHWVSSYIRGPRCRQGLSVCLSMNRLILRQNRNPNSRWRHSLLLLLTSVGLVTVKGVVTPEKGNNFYLSIYEEFSHRLWNWSLKEFCKMVIISQLGSVQFSRSVVSDSLRLNRSQHARPPCSSPTPGVYSNPCP